MGAWTRLEQPLSCVGIFLGAHIELGLDTCRVELSFLLVTCLVSSEAARFLFFFPKLYSRGFSLPGYEPAAIVISLFMV